MDNIPYGANGMNIWVRNRIYMVELSSIIITHSPQATPADLQAYYGSFVEASLLHCLSVEPDRQNDALAGHSVS